MTIAALLTDSHNLVSKIERHFVTMDGLEIDRHVVSVLCVSVSFSFGTFPNPEILVSLLVPVARDSLPKFKHEQKRTPV